MLDTIHEFARECLRRSGFEDDRRGRHLRYYVEQLESVGHDIDRGRYAAWTTFFDAEYPNLLAALALGLDTDTEAALRISLGMRFFWYFHGHVSEGRRMLETALAGAPDAPARLRIRALNVVGVFAGEQRDFVSARRFFSESFATAQAQGERGEAARSLTNLGLLAHYEGDLDASEQLLSRAVALQDEVENARSRGIALKNLGSLLSCKGDLDKAAELLEMSVECARASDDAHEISTALRALARTAVLRGDSMSARKLLEESLEHGRRHESRFAVVECVEVWAGVAAEEGDLESSAVLFGVCEAERESATGAWPSAPQQTWCTRWRSLLRERLGDREFERALQRGRRTTAAQALELRKAHFSSAS